MATSFEHQPDEKDEMTFTIARQPPVLTDQQDYCDEVKPEQTSPRTSTRKIQNKPPLKVL